MSKISEFTGQKIDDPSTKLIMMSEEKQLAPRNFGFSSTNKTLVCLKNEILPIAYVDKFCAAMKCSSQIKEVVISNAKLTTLAANKILESLNPHTLVKLDLS